MALRYLLYLESGGISSWYWQSGQMAPGPSFDNDEGGHAAFAAWLEECRGGHFTVLADCVEEGFQVDTTPHVVGPDRHALIARKQNQYFYGSPYATAISLGRERTGRRDERILFAAITRAALLEPWIERMRTADIVLTGITSPALVLPHLVRPQIRANARLLVVTLTPAGLRQTLFEDGNLRFSRLSTSAESHTTAWSATIPYEVQKTYQYLVTQRVIARGSPVVTAVVVHEQDLAAARSACPDSDAVRYLMLDIGERAQASGLKGPPTDSDATLLLLNAAARQTGGPQFAPARDRLAWRWWVARRFVLAAGMVGLCAALLFASKTVFDTRTLRQSIDDIALDTQTRHLRYERLLATLPKLPVSLDALQAGVGGLERIDALAAGPADALVRLSHAIDRHPGVQVRRIEWSLAPDAFDPRGPAAATGAPDTPALSNVNRGTLRDLLTIEATLPSTSPMSQREAVLAINALLDDIRREGAAEASVVRLPFEYTSDRTLRSNASAREPDARFVLKAAFPSRSPKP
ncbi:hypothetical protein GCM10025771_20540 [Niveibacterium umoris]|uniref:GspL cytoplasmic actin-ATPase-like domain-containing protein n=1 Tax=Niveibacterium umoris TaxID=1193620 RepID=A0A840BPI2_9RHOO|nr:hypothetical protein [Niveibacterium umoris]MBB4012756.1 hypothetical protein [Niveibacterium umoris]